MQGLKAKFVINIFGAVTSIAIALITVPMYVSRIGEDRYGILSLVWIMLGYLGFLDCGLTQATTNALAKLHDAPPRERGSVFMTSLWSNVLLGSLGGLIIYFAGGYVLMTTHGISDSLRAEVHDIMPWLAPMLPLSMAAGVSIGALESRERFLVSNTIQIFSNVFGQTIPLLAAIFISPSLTVVIPVTLGVRALTTVVTLAIVIVTEKLHQFSLFDMRKARKLFHYGMWVTVTNLISPFMTSIDQFVIGNVIGAPFVARYSVAMSAAMRLQFVNGALGKTIFPRFSRFDKNEASALAAKSIVSISYLSAMIFAPALVVVHPFFDFWMGKAFAVYAAPVASVLFFGAWCNGLAFVPALLLLGQGRPDKFAKLHMIEVLPYLGVLWFLVHQIGLTGVAIAWSLRVIADGIALAMVTHLPVRALLPGAPAVVGMLIGLGLGFIVPAWPLPAILAIGTALSLGIGAIGLGMVPYLRENALAMWNKITKRGFS